jgi:integrase
MLRWHYRSRHHSLIAVSNHEFYNDELYIVPSPYSASGSLGLKFNHVPEGVYDRGASRTNKVEAKAVCRAILKHASENHQRTLGVATFSIQQRQAIEDELELLRRNRELELLSKTFSLAIDQGLAINNPCQKVKRFREDNERNRYLSDEEEVRLLSVLIGQRASLRPVVVLAIHTGMRRGELLRLRWANVDFARGLIHVMNSHREQTKSGHSRSIPMNQIARQQLLALQSESGDTEYAFVNRQTGDPRTDVKTGFRSACREAGIKDFHFHDLRHTAATRLGDRGVDTRRIMAILGHRCIQTSARYTHATDEGLRHAMDLLAQRDTFAQTEKADRHSFPHKDEQRPKLAAVSG